MSGEIDYRLVLKDLSERRDGLRHELQKLDSAIDVISRLQAHPSPASAPIRTNIHETVDRGQLFPSGPQSRYAGLTVRDASEKVLEAEHRLLTSREIWDRASAGGLKSQSDKPWQTVWAILRRHPETFEQHGPRWGLCRWKEKTTTD